MKRTLYSLLTVFSCTLLVSCKPTHTPTLGGSSYQQGDQEFQQYANLSSQREQGLVNNAQKRLASGDFSERSDSSNQLNPSNLLSNQKVNDLILKAQFELDNNQAVSALTLLKKAEQSADNLSSAEQLILQKALTQAYFSTDDILSALNSSTIATSLIEDEQDKVNFLSNICQKLQSFNIPELKELDKHAENSTQHGWLDLVLATENPYNANKLIDKIRSWQANYFNHPAQLLLPNLSMQALVFPETPRRITLLLPMHGNLAKQGQAIRNGFLAAFYANKTHGFTPDIKVLDTSQDNVNNLYKKALAAHTDLIVGPLLKSNIEQLTNYQHLSIPVLALNTIPTSQEITNLYQFGLSPEDEAQQAAMKMRQQKLGHILLISPDSTWGKRLKTAFEKTWDEQGGKITQELAYNSRKKLAHELRVLLNLDTSKKRELNLHWLLRSKLRYTPRRRQDFDSIFLIASPSMGRQILPLLRFYYANNIPIYSTSGIYQGFSHPKQDKDLNGVIFDDMPWLFNTNTKLSTKISSIRSNIQSAWPHSFQHYARFYALGADAYNLISNLNKLILLPRLGLPGATGTLFLQSNGQVHRQLIWATMQGGKAEPLY